MVQQGPTLKVTGIEELRHALTELPQDIAKGIFQDALWKGGEIIQRAIYSEAPRGFTGTLKNSVTTRWHSKTASWFATVKGAGIQLDVGPEYSRAKKGYAAHLVEGGTKGHWIRAGQKMSGRSKYIRLKATGKWILASRRADMHEAKHRGFFGKAQYIHAKANPFIRRAFVSSQARAIDRIRRFLSQGIDQAWSRIYRRAA